MKKRSESYEAMLARFGSFSAFRKPAAIFLLIGMAICIMPLLPPVQNAVFSLVGIGITETVGNRDIAQGGELADRLTALLSLSFVALVVLLYAFCCLFSQRIANFLEEEKSKKITIASLAGLTVLLLVLISVFSYRHGWQWLDSDHASEMILGQLLAEENVFASRNWGYSTEIRLIYQTLFTMPLFQLLGGHGNWALIRAINIFLNNLVLVFSYYFMARQLGIRAKWMLITGLFLIAPLSSGYWIYVTFGGYYIFFIAQLLCFIGLFLKLANNADSPKRLPVVFALFTALSFALGVQGIRSLLVAQIPLLIACVYLHLQSSRKRKFSLFLGCYAFILGCVGFLGNFLLHFWFRFHTFDGTGFGNLYAHLVRDVGSSLVSFAIFFGFAAESSFLSASGVFNIASIIITIILFRLAFRMSRRGVIHEGGMLDMSNRNFLPVFFLVAVCFNIFVFVVSDVLVHTRYFFPFMILYVPLAAILFGHSENAYAHLKRTAIIFGVILFVFGQSYLVFRGLSAWDRNSNRKGHIQFLLDNQLNFGFATFWNANIVTELTNGKIAMVGLELDALEPGGSPFAVQFFLNPLKFHESSFHREQQGESFLLLTRPQWELAQSAERPFSLLEPDYEDAHFIVLRFPSAYFIYREVLDSR